MDASALPLWQIRRQMLRVPSGRRSPLRAWRCVANPKALPRRQNNPATESVFFLLLMALLLVQLFDANVAVADELLGVVAAAMHLQGDAALVGGTLPRVRPLQELHALDPGGD